MRSALSVAALLCCGCGRGPFWYIGDAADDDATAPRDCDRADFLFVVDDSPSMRAYQRRLVDNFPVFIDGVARLDEQGTDLHVGVVTSDVYYGNTGSCAVLGGLVTATQGANSSASQCGPFAAGTNYMTNADPLSEAFACAAQVGTLGDQREQPLAAAVAAVDPLGAAAVCNAGFVRDDALLTVVLLTDEPDQSPGDELALAMDLAQIKGGASNVVVVTLTANDGTCRDPQTCYDFGLREFTQWFEFGFLGPIDGDYAEHFDAAVALVAAACAAD